MSSAFCGHWKNPVTSDVVDAGIASSSATRGKTGNREVAALIMLSAGAIVLPIIGWIFGARLVRASAWWTEDERYHARRWPWLFTLTLAVILAYVLAHQTYALDTASKLLDIVVPPIIFVIVATPLIAAGMLAYPVARVKGWFNWRSGKVTQDQATSAR
jgi:hypothetical protein